MGNRSGCPASTRQALPEVAFQVPYSNSINFEIPFDSLFHPCDRISVKVEIAAQRLGSLGSPVRLKIYRALVRAGDDGLAVGDLQERVGLPGSTLSHHIRQLKEAGLISQERQATTLICRADFAVMYKLVEYLVDECCMDGACIPVGRVA